MNTRRTLTNLQKLTFGFSFNQPLNDSLKTLVNLQELAFGHKFYQLLNYSLSGLTKLQEIKVSSRYNLPIYLKRVNIIKN